MIQRAADSPKVQRQTKCCSSCVSVDLRARMSRRISMRRNISLVFSRVKPEASFGTSYFTRRRFQSVSWQTAQTVNCPGGNLSVGIIHCNGRTSHPPTRLISTVVTGFVSPSAVHVRQRTKAAITVFIVHRQFSIQTHLDTTICTLFSLGLFIVSVFMTIHDVSLRSSQVNVTFQTFTFTQEIAEVSFVPTGFSFDLMPIVTGRSDVSSTLIRVFSLSGRRAEKTFPGSRTIPRSVLFVQSNFGDCRSRKTRASAFIVRSFQDYTTPAEKQSC